jgi:excisionase family DNA binding protein
MGFFMSANATSSEGPRWVSIPDAADLLGVSVKTVRRMIARGDLEAKRLGPRLIRINATALEHVGDPIAWAGKR